MIMNDDKNADRLFEAITSCIDDGSDLTLEELRATRRLLGHDVEKSEKTLLAQLTQLRTTQAANDTRQRVASGITTLLDHARRVGVNPIELADRSGLSVSLVTKLDLRLVRNTPRSVIERLAQLLDVAVESLAEYLRQPPAIAKAAQYRSKEAPSMPAVQDFFDAVAADRSISEERREKLLQFRDSE